MQKRIIEDYVRLFNKITKSVRHPSGKTLHIVPTKDALNEFQPDKQLKFLRDKWQVLMEYLSECKRDFTPVKDTPIHPDDLRLTKILNSSNDIEDWTSFVLSNLEYCKRRTFFVVWKFVALFDRYSENIRQLDYLYQNLDRLINAKEKYWFIVFEILEKTENMPKNIKETIYSIFHNQGSWYATTKLVEKYAETTDVSERTNKFKDLVRRLVIINE